MVGVLFRFPLLLKMTITWGLKFRYVDSVFDRGKSKTNEIEAKAIVDRVIEHANSSSSKTLGVVTFSKAQKEKIESELEKHKLYKHYRGFCEDQDKFFVKNLESVQGDEMDIILVSIGYGYDKNRKMTLNFGPINYEGGEKRLNVIMTRAKEKM